MVASAGHSIRQSALHSFIALSALVTKDLGMILRSTLSPHTSKESASPSHLTLQRVIKISSVQSTSFLWSSSHG